MKKKNPYGGFIWGGAFALFGLYGIPFLARSVGMDSELLLRTFVVALGGGLIPGILLGYGFHNKVWQAVVAAGLSFCGGMLFFALEANAALQSIQSEPSVGAKVLLITLYVVMLAMVLLGTGAIRR